MGVKGVRTFLRQQIKVSRRILTSGSTLVIDGDGWMFHLLQQCRRKLNMDTGGSYKEFASVVLAEVNRLKSYGLELVVLFDGPKNPLKDRTTIERLKRREREWASLHQFYSTETVAHNPEDFPIAPLCKEQLMATLDLCSVSHLHCINEADQEIALLVQQQNLLCTPDTKCFAYALDSDFIAMKDCPYIEFGDIDFDSEGRLSATIWDRAHLCRTLNISETQFLDFVMFLGNDYTAPLIVRTDLYARMHQVFNGNVSLIMQDWFRKVTNQKRAVLRAVDLFRPLPPHCSPLEHESRMQYISQLQFAMDYSHAFYNLEPLDHFYEHARLTLPPAVPYSSASCVFDFHYYSDSSEGKFFADLGRYVKAAGKMGTEGVDRGVAVHALTYLKRKCTSTANASTISPVVTDEHRAAIQMMLKQLQQSSTHCETDELQPPPLWEDLLAAYVYQKTCALVMKSFPQGAFVGEHNAPVKVFEAVLFHAALRGLRSSVAAANLSQPAPATEIVSPAAAGSFATDTETSTECADGAAIRTVPQVFVDCAELVDTTSQLSVPVPGKVDAKEQECTRSTINNATSKASPPPASLPVPRYKPPRGSSFETETFGKSCPTFKREPWSDGPRPSDTWSSFETSKPLAYRAPMSRAEALRPERPPPQRGTVMNESKYGPPRPEFSRRESAPQPSPSNVINKLPVDAHRETILRHIQSNRVTIIHGETGCGKSSRLPHFLLEDAEASNRHCKIFVSQPRRIGVVGMLKHLRPVLGDKVGMRMGHGVRDETEATRLHYVTTGYLVQMVAHRSEAIKKITHIVIDEVHERSVDGDLICLLVRDLLLEYAHLRVILMSATINTDLYQDYFSQYDDGTFGTMDCLSVGVKRFPVEMHYLEDLCNEKANGIRRCALEVLANEPATQYGLVVALLRSVCNAGSTVLVFISGLEDIMSIAALLERYPQFLVCPLHSTTPEEEQDLAFEPTPPENIKVVLATNMAESSVTIPDCDVVICLGTHKSISYSEKLKCTHVAFGLISKASATQRAGRTGRVRPGTVYRLYSKSTFEKMREHDLPEVLRRPLEDVVLNMWTVLEEAQNFQGVTPFLNRLIEVPDVRFIDKSYQKLYSTALITFPSDDGFLTPAGRFVSALPIDLPLGRMVSYGVLLGVPAEAIVMAASVSLSRPHPYRMASTIFLDPDRYNEQIRNRFLSEVHYDQGDYSEPIARIRLLLDWRELGSDKERYHFCHYNNLQFGVMKQFDSTVVSLVDHLLRFQKTLSPTAKRVNIDCIGTMSASTVNTLRLIMLWSFPDNILNLDNGEDKVETSLASEGAVEIESDKVTVEHMETLFGSIPYSLHVSETSETYSFSRVIEFTEQDSYLRLVQLVDRLATVAASYDTQGFAIITETIETDRSQAIFVILPGENQHTMTLQLKRCMDSKPRATVDPLAARLVSDCLCVVGAEIVTYNDATQLEIELVREILSSVTDTIFLTVPTSEIACLESAFIPLSPIHVAHIFGVVVTNKKGKKIFTMDAPFQKVTTLKFPQESQRVRTSLIKDLPLGHRFVQCCRANRNNNRLVVSLKASEVTDADLIDDSWMEEPYKAHRANKCPQREVLVESVLPVWHYVRGLTCYRVKMPRQGMISASFHCGPESLFAVALTALPHTNHDFTSFVTGGVSFLPTNPAWLRLALHVVNKDHVWDDQWEKEENSEGKEVEPIASMPKSLQKRMDLAGKIGILLKEASEFQRRDDIVAKVHALFSPFAKNYFSLNEKPDQSKSGTSKILTEPLEFRTVAASDHQTLVGACMPGHGKVIALPPSAPKAIIPPRLTNIDQKINQNHGYDQANAYKLAHEARKRAATNATTETAATLSKPTGAPKSLTLSRAENHNSARTGVDTQHASMQDWDASSDDGDDWEKNAEKFSEKLKNTYSSTDLDFM